MKIGIKSGLMILITHDGLDNQSIERLSFTSPYARGTTASSLATVKANLYIAAQETRMDSFLESWLIKGCIGSYVIHRYILVK